MQPFYCLVQSLTYALNIAITATFNESRKPSFRFVAIVKQDGRAELRALPTTAQERQPAVCSKRY